MACVDLQLIDGDECIGASLPKINGNFAALSAAVCDLSASVPNASLNVFDSPTIDLDWNASTRTLSAVTTSMVATSSSPMVAKAWVLFNGTGTGTGTPTVSSSFNVSSVVRTSTGDFRVNFATNMPSNNYIVVANASITSGTPYNVGTVIHSSQSALIPPSVSSFSFSVYYNTGGGGAPTPYVNVCVF